MELPSFVQTPNCWQLEDQTAFVLSLAGQTLEVQPPNSACFDSGPYSISLQ